MVGVLLSHRTLYLKQRRDHMDQIKIGRFIAESRRLKDLTQVQLADKLGITDKAVSKWERGIASFVIFSASA